MKIFKSKSKNILFLSYRLVNQVIDPIKFFLGLNGFIWYLRDLVKFKKLDKDVKIRLLDLYPMLHDKTDTTKIDAHYFYQQLWVFENVLKNKPKEHVDIGSTYQMSGYLSKIVPTTFIDIRPIDAKLKNLKVKNASILKLPYKDNSLESISCLHVIEHIGLGRYGDDLDPIGWKKACNELKRVLARGGKLYLSVPVGKARICFNAHRVFPPLEIFQSFSELKLKEFSFVNDEGKLSKNTDISNTLNQNYACGFYLFEKF